MLAGHRFSDTVATYANQWIPIRPTTDTAMLIAMAYVIVTEKLQDQKFLDKYTIGFDKFRDYVIGKGDGIPKTPAWAEAITGVPEATIENLAREYATSKPAALILSYGPGRSAYGEQYHRAGSTLAAMTGNIGLHGGYAAGDPYVGEAGISWRPGAGLPIGKNPVEGENPPPAGLGSCGVRSPYRPHSTKVWDAILKGKAVGYPSDIKMLYIASRNILNQWPNLNKGIEALKKLEFVVVHELFMTPTAKFADILLPVSAQPERADIFRPWNWGAYFLHSSKAVEPLGECKSDFEICCELAPRLGISDYTDKTMDEWLRQGVKTIEDLTKESIDYDEVKKKGFYKIPISEPVIAFKEQIEDPQNNPFPTPSGKIEIYSQQLADLHNPRIPPIPKYIEAWEEPGDPLARKYPLQLVTPHFKGRSHSSYDSIPWLRELEPQVVWINTTDARNRGIADGDEVGVFNDIGQIVVPAKVTQRIMPGVVCLYEGAWFAPDENGIDRGGCCNVLTKDERSPGGAFITNTCLIQVEKL
ncbi:molybdopterin-dependent oxidoreductase [Chloroflexota bacterium]